MSEPDFASLMPAVAERLWGPVKERAGPREWRYGQQRTINPQKGVWTHFGHTGADGKPLGGGVLKLIEHELKLKGQDAIRWLNQNVGANIEVRANGHDHSAPPLKGVDQARARVVATYDYTDAAGQLVYQVQRKEDGSIDPKTGKPRKSFIQRRPDGRGGWAYDLQGVEPTLYRLPELHEAIAQDTLVFIVEGEKKVDVLAEIGVPATCNSGGSKKWREEFAEHFAGADVVIMPDNDDPGREHAKVVAAALAGTAKRVRILDLPDLPAKGDVVDWLGKGGTIERLYDLVASDAREPGKEPYVSPFHAVPFWEIDNPGPQHEWLIKGMETLGEVGLIAGESGTAKSFLALDQGMAIARGLSWMGRRVEQGVVLYNAGEGGMGFKTRLRAYREENGIPKDERVPFILLPRTIDLYATEDHTDQLIAEIHHWAEFCQAPVRKLYIDTFSASTPGADENAAKDMSVVLKRGKRIAEETGVQVSFVQHMNASGEKIRGWTGIKANVDSVLICRNTDQADSEGRPIYELELDKCKDGKRGIRWQYVLKEVQLGDDRHGDPITSCVIDHPNGKADPNRPAYETFSTAMRDTFAAIKKAITDFGEKTPGGLSLPMSITTVTTLQAVIEVYVRNILVVDAKATETEQAKARETARKSIQRGGADLRDRGYIGREGRWIWLTGKEPTGRVRVNGQGGRKGR